MRRSGSSIPRNRFAIEDNPTIWFIPHFIMVLIQLSSRRNYYCLIEWIDINCKDTIFLLYFINNNWFLGQTFSCVKLQLYNLKAIHYWKTIDHELDTKEGVDESIQNCNCDVYWLNNRNRGFPKSIIANCTFSLVLPLSCRSKAYSIEDGKEVIFHTIKIMLWKPEIVRCFMNALRIVREYKSCV